MEEEEKKQVYAPRANLHARGQHGDSKLGHLEGEGGEVQHEDRFEKPVAPIPNYDGHRCEKLENLLQKHKFNDENADALMKEVVAIKNRRRPISIRFDRFGRIAVNKDRELSQASLN